MPRGRYWVEINLKDNAANEKYYFGNKDFDGTFDVV